MAGKFELKKFSEIDSDDLFFESLKHDYPGDEHNTSFVKWFEKKSENDSTALVFTDELGIGAFVCLKDESEEIYLQDKILPVVTRKKNLHIANC